MTITTDKAREIARGLTEAQRRAVLDAVDGNLCLKDGLAHIVKGLVKHGLLRDRVRGQEMDRRLTRSGLDVRQALQESSNV